MFSTKMVVSAFGDCFPPRFSFYCGLLPCDLLSCDWTGDDGGSKGNCYPSARSCQCGAVGPHGWLTICVFSVGEVSTPPKETWPAGMPLLVTHPETSKLASSQDQTLYFLWSMHEDYFTQPLSTVKLHKNSRIAMEWMVGTGLEKGGEPPSPFAEAGTSFWLWGSGVLSEWRGKQTNTDPLKTPSFKQLSEYCVIPVFVLWG